MNARSLLVLTTFTALALCSCMGRPPSHDAGDETPIEIEGVYRGRYWVTHEEGNQEQIRQDGAVMVRFHEGHYEVEGQRRLLPPAGSGKYRVEGRVLILEDTAMHTADFDWSLILDGRFDIDPGQDGHLRLTQRDLDHDRYHELDLDYEAPASTTR